jgi:hypothetical protein
VEREALLVAATRKASDISGRQFASRGRITPAAKSPPSISSRAPSCHPEVLLLSRGRGRFPEDPRNGTPQSRESVHNDVV